jgi:hypothetical protein
MSKNKADKNKRRLCWRKHHQKCSASMKKNKLSRERGSSHDTSTVKKRSKHVYTKNEQEQSRKKINKDLDERTKQRKE